MRSLESEYRILYFSRMDMEAMAGNYDRFGGVLGGGEI